MNVAVSAETGVATGRYRRWTLVAFLAFLLTLTGVVAGKRQALGDLGFLRDEAYLNLAVCDHWVQEGVYGVGGHPIPATRDVLWRALIAGCDWLCNDLITAPYLLGALFGLVALSLVMSLSWRTVPRVGGTLLAALLLIFGGGLVLDAVAGRGGTLLSALCAWACLLHVRGCSPGRAPLPLGAALLVGLAALVHIEFVVLWLAFTLHALLQSFSRRPGEPGFLAVLVRAITGAVVVAILLSPLLWWNTKVLGVPWPRMPGAPMTLDAWAVGAPGEAWARMQELMREAFANGYTWAHQVPFLRGWPERIAAWLGVALVLVDAVRDRARRPLTGLLAVVLLPLVFAPVYPYVGLAYAVDVFRALQPAWIVLAVYAVARLADGVTWLLDRGAPACPAFARRMAPLVLIGALLAFNGAARTVHELRAGRDALREAQAGRKAAREQLTALGARPEDAVVTDRPGWLLRERIGRVLDLTGAVTPVVLAYQDPRGAWEIEGLSGYLRTQQAAWVMIWSPAEQPLADALGCPGREGVWPRICRATGP